MYDEGKWTGWKSFVKIVEQKRKGEVAKMDKGKVEAPKADKPHLIHVLVNGKRVTEGRMIDGKVYAPLRIISEAMGGAVTWDHLTQTAMVVGKSEGIST